MAKSPAVKKTSVKPAVAKETASPSLKAVVIEAGKAEEVVRAAEATSKKIYMVPLAHLHIAPGFNVRIVDDPAYKRRILELRDSILSHGFFNTKPLAAFVGKLPGSETDAMFITDGHRRLEAVKLANAVGAGIERLPIILKPASTTAEDLTNALFEENDQQNLSGMERAILAKRLIGLGRTKEEIAVKFRVGIRQVENYLALVAAPKSVRELVKNGLVSATEAMRVLRLDPSADKKDAEAKLNVMADKLRNKATSGAEGKKAAKITTAKVDTHDATGDVPSVKMETITIRSAGAAGTTMSYEDIARFKDLFADSDWYSLTDKDGVIELNEPFEITVKLRRLKKPKPEAEIETIEESEDAKPKKKKGRPKKAEDAPVGVEVDPMTMSGIEESSEEPDEEDVPDLRELGIGDASDL